MNYEFFNNQNDIEYQNIYFPEQGTLTINNNFFNSEKKKLSTKENNNNIKEEFRNNENKIQNINNIYHNIKFKRRRIQKEEIKNYDYTYNNDIYRNIKNEINNQTLLFQYNKQQKSINKTYLLNCNSPNNIMSNKNKLINVGNPKYQQNISPIKINLFHNSKPFYSERKQNKYNLSDCKNKIIKIDKVSNDFNNTFNIDDNNKIPNIPKNDVCLENFENSIIKKENNNINIIQIPKKFALLNTEIKKNLFNENVNQNISKRFNNYYSPQRKNFKNIDINMDYFNEKTMISQKIVFSNSKSPKKPKQLFSKVNSHLKYKVKSGNQNNIKLFNKNEQELKPFNIEIKKIKNINNDDFKISWSGKSKAGKDKNKNVKINQDAFRVCENINNIKNFNIYILCDGHGRDGHYVSKYITENIISMISSHSLKIFHKNIEEIYNALIKNNYQLIKDIFSQIDICLSLQKDFDTEKSGCTCILILQIGSKIISANIGDSRAILVYSNSQNLFKTKTFPLSLDSKPDLPSELKRIINCGGEVHKNINKKGEYVGPMRVFARGKDFPGLAMSRSFGDFQSKQYGVINEPTFVEYCLDENCRYIVICSDGVWDFIDNDNVVKIGNRHYLNNNPEGFCLEILEKASYWWQKEDIVIDDITALIVFFKFIV